MVDGEQETVTEVIVGGGGGGGLYAPPPQPETKPIRTIREMNHVRVGFQPNRICR